jgi:hypothetical protein
MEDNAIAKNVLVSLRQPIIGKTNFGIPEKFLNTALCQFSPAASKTQKAINFIKHFSLLHRVLRGPSENGIHHITIVATNNSLLETKQWKFRLNNKTNNMNITTLSSNKNSTFRSTDQINSKLVRVKNAGQLPDILCMPTNGIRTNDILDIIKTFQEGNLDFTRIGIRQISLTIMFDEADKNIQLIAQFMKEFMELVQKDNGCFNYAVRDVHFITATPLTEFWKKLRSAGITKLQNINKYLEQSPDYISLTHEELEKDYRKLSDHTHRADIQNQTEDPIEYAALVLAKLFDERHHKKRTDIYRVFAPAELYIETHNKMAELFNAHSMVALVIDGPRKGFQYPDGTFESIEDFNKKHNIQGELYDTLVKWESLHSDLDLGITGYLSIERGVTFNTKGFNFTDMIVSKYHLRNLSSLIQLLGRANGGKEYVKIMSIWAPTCVIKDANEQIDIMNELHKTNPAEYDESQFRKKNKKEIMEPAMTVPILIALSDAEWSSVLTMKKGKEYNLQNILSIIESKDKDLANDLRKLHKKQITMPKDEIPKKGGQSSYKKHITDLKCAIQENRKYSVDITKKEYNKDVYQIFLDEVNKHFIVSVFYGSRLPKQESDSDAD